MPSPRVRNFSDASKLSSYASSGVYLAGYRPLILTLASEAPLPDGDVIAVEQALDGTAFLLRTTKITSITTVDDWHDANMAQAVGPQLPAGVGRDVWGAIIAQASGGHANPVFYVGTRTDTSAGSAGQVFRLNGTKTAWNMIVPNNTLATPVKSALQWFVDPYEPTTIYVLDQDGVKVSADGGGSWFLDASLHPSGHRRSEAHDFRVTAAEHALYAG